MERDVLQADTLHSGHVEETPEGAIAVNEKLVVLRMIGRTSQ